MTLANLKLGVDIAGAALAFGAAVAWFLAARASLPVGAFPDWSNAEGVGAALDDYRAFLKGAVWNQRAAILAGLSALAAGVSTALSTLIG
jgi:hypothetical protein